MRQMAQPLNGTVHAHFVLAPKSAQAHLVFVPGRGKLKPNNGAYFESRPSNCYRCTVDFVHQQQLLIPASEVAGRQTIPF
jgi:hypothetical protein